MYQKQTGKAPSRIRSVVGCIVIMLSLGILYLWSLFQEPVIKYLQWDASDVTMVPAIMLCCFTVGNFSGGLLSDRKGPRVTATLGGLLYLVGNVASGLVLHTCPKAIFLTYSGLAGLGAGLGYNTALNCIQKWFPNNRGTGAGLAIATFGLSTTVWAFPIERLLTLPAFGAHAVPATFCVLGILFGGAVIVAAQFVGNPVECASSSVQSQQRQYSMREALRCPEMWIACVCMSLPEATFFMLNPIIKTLGITRALTPVQASLTVSLTGIFSAAARLLGPMASDRLGRSRVGIAFYLVNILSAILLTFVTGVPYIITVQLVVMAYGGPAGIAAAIITESFGTKYSGTNFGVTIIFFGIASYCFPKLSTWLYGTTGSYTIPFLIGAAACIPAIILIGMYDRLHIRRMERDRQVAGTAP